MLELQVDGMTCSGCVRSLTSAVQRLDPGASVDVELASKRVRITAGATLPQITAAITDAGYEVTASATV